MTPQEQHYKELIENALRKWLKGDPSTTNLINVIIEDVVKVIANEKNEK